jgi:multiple sugar transport system ATP-binding protein
VAGVELRNVGKKYGAVAAIHGVSIDVGDGEFVVLVGPSGCGKSTLLRMIAGLEDITSGTISIGGEVVNDLAPKDRDIAMVFQSYALYPHMTVEENLGFSLKLAGVGVAEARPRVMEAARILGLEGYLDRYPRQLSGGQRQRVAMGRAIVRQPAAFLFDEPLSNLDAKLRVTMRTEVKALHQRLRSTIVYVTHDQIEAMTMADRIVVLRDGRVEQIGTPIQLYERPANRFVATFIGSPGMNMLRAWVAGGRIALSDGQSFDLPRRAAELEGREVTLGIRPEHLRRTGDGLRGEILTVEPTGAQTFVHFGLDGIDCTAVLDGKTDLRPGETVVLDPDRAHLHLFDPETGRRLTAADCA